MKSKKNREMKEALDELRKELKRYNKKDHFGKSFNRISKKIRRIIYE